MAMDDRERDVCRRLEAMRQRMVDELAAWVAIPTGRGHAAGLHAQRAALAHRLRGLGAVIVRTTSAADAFCIATTSMSASLAWSIRRMMRSMRFTLLARSAKISILEEG